MTALAGLKVLDFTRLLPGPFATRLLADLGADVVCVASSRFPDLFDTLPPFVDGGEGPVSATSAWLHRGKRSIVLSLTHPRGQEVARRLAARVDVVVEQFKPGTMARFGLDAPRLLAENPRLVYASLTAFGQTGPLAARPGHDLGVLALSGLLSYSGTRAGGPPPLGLQVADLAGASNLAIGVLAALLHRERTGEGQHVDVAMLDAALDWNALAGAAGLAAGADPEREAHLLNGGSLYGCYPTKDGRHLAFAGLEPRFVHEFARSIGCPELADGGVAPPDLEAARARVANAVAERTLAEWEEALAGFDTCAEPVLTLHEALDRPQARARGMRLERALADGSTLAQVGVPLRFSRSAPEPGGPGGPPGANSRAVLLGAGFDEAEIQDLERSGALR
jgi:crotonobetainyl-CoA:carnitine CoA-transferase CaiB-like acyl-CoA transferase